MWLSKNHAASNGVWLLFFKKDSGLQTFSYPQALETALCYGWIDGQRKGNDEKSFLQKYTPRRKKSVWSKINTGHVEQLMKLGKMKPAGIAEVKRAMADGRWANAYAPPSQTIIPKDFLAELAKNKKAKAFWETLNKSNKYAVVWQIDGAKKEETRKRRIDTFVSMLEKREKLN